MFVACISEIYVKTGKTKKNNVFDFSSVRLPFCSVHAEYVIFRFRIMLSMLYSVDLIRKYYVGVVIITVMLCCRLSMW